MKYLIGVVLAILVIIFVIIKLLSGGGGSSETPVAPRTLASYANTDTTVRYVIDNAVQANDSHRDIIVSVGKDAATLTITKGYQGEVVSSKSYGNNSDAYAAFLLSLDHSGGFTLGDTDKTVRDERGYCATGNRYSYDIVDASNSEIQHYWSTSCKEKTFNGAADVVQQLFESQIPDFDTLTSDVDF